MQLAIIDWVLIAIYMIFSVAIALIFSKSSGKSLGEFFLGGRRLPWYLAGVSMVATTFAADTPLAVTELVYKNGISGNWLWWNMLIGGMLTTFFFARLWRRADVLTEVEFITLRYGGQAASWLRYFKAIYLGGIMNVLVIGWVNLALVSIFQAFFGLDESTAIWYTGAAMVITAIYSSIGGYMSVAVTDMFQFVIAMGGSIILAVLVLNSERIGGVSGLQEKLGADHPAWNFLPTTAAGGATTLGITLSSFVAFFCFQWWASWYPGAEPGGGGYVAQRIMSARSERDSVIATLFFQVAHYCLRPWPWIIVALCALVLYPGLGADEAKLGYVMAMRDFLPDGLRGLLLVAFLAAYMSTISTQLNWGASYLVNDVVKPIGNVQDFDGSVGQKTLVLAGRAATILLMIVGFGITWTISSISEVWAFMVECGAGLGLVLILRWFWWRINVWSEISATVAPFVFYAISRFVLPDDHFLATYPNSYFFTIGGTTLTWLLVTFATQPESMEVLGKFHARVRPGGLWGPVQDHTGVPAPKSNTLPLLLSWALAVGMTYLILFATGKLLFGQMQTGLILLGSGLACGLGLLLVVQKFGLFKNEEPGE